MSVYNLENIPFEFLFYKLTIMKRTLFIILAVSFVTLFLSKEFSLGFFVGGLIAMANFSLLAKYILKMRELSVNKAKRFIVSRFFIIYLIMAAALFIGATKGMAVFFGVAAGLLTVKFAIYINGIFAKHVKPS